MWITVRHVNLDGVYRVRETRSWRTAWEEIRSAGCERDCKGITVHKLAHTAYVWHDETKCTS